MGKSTNESTPVANLTFEVNIILPTYVTTEKVRKSVLPPPQSPKQKVPSYRNFVFWVLRVHHLARKFGKFNQNHNIIGNIEFIKKYTHHKNLWKCSIPNPTARNYGSSEITVPSRYCQGDLYGRKLVLFCVCTGKHDVTMISKKTVFDRNVNVSDGHYK